MRTILLACVGASMVAGCASQPPITSYVTERNAFSVPEVGTVAVATIGSELLSQGVSSEHDVLTLHNPIKLLGGFVLNPGSYPKTGESEEATFYGATYTEGITWADGSPKGYVKGGVMASPINYVRYTPATNEICLQASLDMPRCADAGPVTFEKRTAVSAESFQQTLLYNGKIGNTLTIAYREFSRGMARDAFSNEVQYDLGASDIIAYKGAQLRVIRADNTSIEYEVISNFN